MSNQTQDMSLTCTLGDSSAYFICLCTSLFFSSTNSRELISSQITTNNDRLYTTRQLTTACSTTARVRLKLERSTRGKKHTTGKTARMKRVCGGATSRREYAELWASWSEQMNSWRKVIHSSTHHNGNPLSLASHGYERRKKIRARRRWRRKHRRKNTISAVFSLRYCNSRGSQRTAERRERKTQLHVVVSNAESRSRAHVV